MKRFGRISSIVFLVLALSLLSTLAIPVISLADSDSDSDSDSERRGRDSVTGVWFTKRPSPFIIQLEEGPVREKTDMRWELVEDADGLVTGYNTYAAVDDQGQSPSAGVNCMVGARNGSRIILSEAPSINPTFAYFSFGCELDGSDELRCLGDGNANLEPIALQAVLERVSDSVGDSPFVPELVRSRCQPDM